MTDPYYQIQAAIIQAAATLAAGMPEPTAKEINEALGNDHKDKLVSLYTERFSMAFVSIRNTYIETYSEGHYPAAPKDSSS